MMTETPHGTIDVSIEGNIIIASYVGQFNETGLNLGVQKIRTAIDDLTGQPFAMLIDNLQLIGGTPESYAALEVFNQWLNTQAMVAKATVIDSTVKLKIIDSLVTSRSTQNHRAFRTMAEAIAWLNEQLQASNNSR